MLISAERPLLGMYSSMMVSVRWPPAEPVPSSLRSSADRSSRLSEPTSTYTWPSDTAAPWSSGTASTLSIRDQTTQASTSSAASSMTRIAPSHRSGRGRPRMRGARGARGGRCGGASGGRADGAPGRGRSCGDWTPPGAAAPDRGASAAAGPPALRPTAAGCPGGSGCSVPGGLWATPST